jgi:hypothetical protein
MEIPRTTSLPIDPSRPSILDFPAELRILIYEFLFKRDGPLLLHNREAFYRKPEPLKEEDGFLLEDEDESSQDVPEEDVPEEDAKFRHGLGAGINLIATCRQIYYEASDTLYGQNDFLISRMMSTQHLHYTYDRNYSFTHTRAKEYHQFFYAGQWVAQIGQNAQWLRKVKIDGDAVCECAGCNEVDILPLLRLKWNMPTCNIEFIHTGRYLPNIYEPGFQPESRTLEDRIMRLRVFLHAVGEQDSLNIRRYYKYYRNLTAVRVPLVDGSFHGAALFHGVSPWGRREKDYRRVRMNTVHDRSSTMPITVRSLEWETDPQIMRESGDPARWLLEEQVSIHRDAIYTSGDCTIDVDKRTTYGLDTSLLRILPLFSYSNRDVHYCLPRTGCYVIISALYHPIQAVYQNRHEAAWKGAEFLTDVKLYSGHAAWIARQAVEQDRAKMVLRIRDQPAQKVRVDLRHLDLLLVEREGHIGNGTEFVIQIEETTGDHIASISVETLRRHWFIYLTDLLDSTPEYINPEMSATYVDYHWNIITGDRRPLSRPPSDEDWRSFLEHPASAYNRVEPRLRRRHKFPCPDTRVMTYWFCLKHILCEMWPESPEDWIDLMNLFTDFPTAG